jgi:hypothetical protein
MVSLQRIKMKKKIKFVSTQPDLEIPHPRPASRMVPEWYRFSEQSVEGVDTVKKCVPFLDSMISGYMITLPSDIYFSHGEIQEISKIGAIGSHRDGQLGNLKIPKEYHDVVFKWLNMFTLKTPKGYSTLFTHPANRIDLPFFTFSGVVDTDAFPLQVNFPFLIRKDFVGIIPAGTPIAQAIPFKREQWESEIEDSKEYIEPAFAPTIHNPPFKFYKRNFWKRKNYS